MPGRRRPKSKNCSKCGRLIFPEEEFYRLIKYGRHMASNESTGFTFCISCGNKYILPVLREWTNNV